MRGLDPGETIEQWAINIWSAGRCDNCQCDIEDVRSIWVWDDLGEKVYQAFNCPDLCPYYQESEFEQIKRVAEDHARVGHCFCSEICAEKALDDTRDHCDWCHKVMQYDKEPYMVSDDMLHIMPFNKDDFREVENILTFCCLLCAEDYLSHR